MAGAEKCRAKIMPLYEKARKSGDKKLMDKWGPKIKKEQKYIKALLAYCINWAKRGIRKPKKHEDLVQRAKCKAYESSVENWLPNTYEMCMGTVICNGKDSGCGNIQEFDGNCDKNSDCRGGLQCGIDNCWRGKRSFYENDDNCCYDPSLYQIS
jgi:hypothetical protein